MSKRMQGVSWKKLGMKGASKESLRLYNNYLVKHEEAKTAAQLLKESLLRDLAKKHPEGNGSQVGSINVINGVVLFAWVTKRVTDVEELEELFT